MPNIICLIETVSDKLHQRPLWKKYQIHDCGNGFATLSGECLPIYTKSRIFLQNHISRDGAPLQSQNSRNGGKAGRWKEEKWMSHAQERCSTAQRLGVELLSKKQSVHSHNIKANIPGMISPLTRHTSRTSNYNVKECKQIGLTIPRGFSTTMGRKGEFLFQRMTHSIHYCTRLSSDVGLCFSTWI